MVAPKFADGHRWQTCTVDECELCQAEVDLGFVMACDDCHEPGSTDSTGWTMAPDGLVYCNHCIDAHTKDPD